MAETANTPVVRVGVFHTRAAADRAVAELKAKGFPDEHIGLLVKDERGVITRMDGTGMTKGEEGLLGGAAVGAAAGAAFGVGVAAGVIPVVGPVLAVGALGTVLLNAIAGAAVSGLAGGLIAWGIPEDDARYYEDELKAGRYLITVRTDDISKDLEDCLVRHGGYDRATAPGRGRGRR